MAALVRSAFSIPLRVTAKVLYVAHGIHVSHEYVRGKEVDAGSQPVKAPPGVGSGVYACDEQHLKVLGKQAFRHAVVDSAGGGHRGGGARRQVRGHDRGLLEEVARRPPPQGGGH